MAELVLINPSAFLSSFLFAVSRFFFKKKKKSIRKCQSKNSANSFYSEEIIQWKTLPLEIVDSADCSWSLVRAFDYSLLAFCSMICA